MCVCVCYCTRLSDAFSPGHLSSPTQILQFLTFDGVAQVDTRPTEQRSKVSVSVDYDVSYCRGNNQLTVLTGSCNKWTTCQLGSVRTRVRLLFSGLIAALVLVLMIITVIYLINLFVKGTYNFHLDSCLRLLTCQAQTPASHSPQSLEHSWPNTTQIYEVFNNLSNNLMYLCIVQLTHAHSIPTHLDRLSQKEIIKSMAKCNKFFVYS